MARLIIAGLLLAGAIAAFGVTGTLTYFTGTRNESGSLTTATISVDGTSGFPISFSHVLPGEAMTQTVSVTNGSNRPADLYVQLQTTGGTTLNFCTPDAGVNLRIVESGVGDWYNDNICKLYPGWSGSLIVKFADDVAAGASVTRDIVITLPGDLPGDDSSYEGGTVNNTVHLIAVQYNGPAPAADKDGPGSLFPADGGADDDPNYP
jgi:hypothetical protein